MKIHQIVPVEFPGPGVRAAAAENSDGTYTFYVNSHLSEEARKEAVEELAGKIQGQSRTAKEEGEATA